MILQLIGHETCFTLLLLHTPWRLKALQTSSIGSHVGKDAPGFHFGQCSMTEIDRSLVSENKETLHDYLYRPAREAWQRVAPFSADVGTEFVLIWNSAKQLILTRSFSGRLVPARHGTVVPCRSASFVSPYNTETLPAGPQSGGTDILRTYRFAQYVGMYSMYVHTYIHSHTRHSLA